MGHTSPYPMLAKTILPIICHVAAPITSCHGGRTASAVTGVAPERRLALTPRWFVPHFMVSPCKNALARMMYVRI